MVRQIDISYKTKVAWNQIPSNFAFLEYIDPMHRLGASVKKRKIELFLLSPHLLTWCDDITPRINPPSVRTKLARD